MTQTYRVIWEIDIDADCPEEAAAIALIVQRDDDPLNVATTFDCVDEDGETRRVDLFDLEGKIADLAKAFSNHLRSVIGEDNMAKVVQRNAEHDFCDANQVMLDAFRDVFGRDAGPSDTYLIDEAWLKAREREFMVK